MADLTENQSAGITKIIGSDATGVEQTPVQSTASGGLHSNLRTAVGVELLGQQASAASIPTALSVSQEAILQGISNNTAAVLVDTLASGSISALNGSVVVSSQGSYTVGVSVSGTFSAFYIAEGQNADNSWTTVPLYSTSNGVPYTLYYGTGIAGQYIIIAGAYQNVRIRCYLYTSGTILVSLNASIAQQAVFAAQMGSWKSEIIDSTKLSYSAAITGLAIPTAPTDIFTITGSATKLTRITRISVSASQVTAAQRDVILIKRSTANTAGTSTTLVNVPHDTSNTAATCVVKAYTVSPTLGTAVGPVRSRKVYIATTATNSDEYFIEFGQRPAQSMILRGINESLAINLNSATSAGGSFNIYIEWTEE